VENLLMSIRLDKIQWNQTKRLAHQPNANKPRTLTFGQGPKTEGGDTFKHHQGLVNAGNITNTLLFLPLSQSRTTKSFVAQMKRLIKKSPWVQIDHTRLAEVALALNETPKLLDWKGYISDQAFNANPPDLNRVMFELALNIANQGGFITAEPGEKAKKWEIGGSGAAAMVQVINKIREAGMLPGLDLKAPEQVSEKIGPLLDGVPFREERLSIFQEFAQPSAYKALGKILEKARTGPNSYRFTLSSVKALAKALPKSFGFDPFYKKASLVMIAVAGVGRPRGLEVQLDIPIPADYRLPQTLEGLGIFRFSPEVNDALEKGHSFHEDHTVVQHLRAASIVASAELSKQTGFDSAAIDSLLWGAARKLSKAEPIPGTSKYEPKPHMMVPTMRF
jgi:Potential Queuosine, Q, salvage protein family